MSEPPDGSAAPQENAGEGTRHQGCSVLQPPASWDRQQPPAVRSAAHASASPCSGTRKAPGKQSAVPCYLSARSHKRIHELAQPKKAASANDPRLMWGNQEVIWARSRGVVTAQLPPRTAELAKPKKDFGKQQSSCGWESTIRERPLLLDFGLPSDRLLKLSEPKKYQPAYLEKRPRESCEWPVSRAALNYKASPRILELARAKVLPPEFLPPRELPTKVTNAAALARASSRIQRLAEPRIRRITCCYESVFLESVIRPVSKFAQQAVASPRIVELARPKRLHPDYVPMRDAQWPVTEAAKHAVATPRVLELAQPCKRPPMSSVQVNPDAFTVKEMAKKAICSARIQELARPIKR